MHSIFSTVMICMSAVHLKWFSLGLYLSSTDFLLLLIESNCLLGDGGGCMHVMVS